MGRPLADPELDPRIAMAVFELLAQHSATARPPSTSAAARGAPAPASRFTRGAGSSKVARRAMAGPTASRSSGHAPESALHHVLRLAAIGVGLPLCIAAGAAWMGSLTESPWIALGAASAIALIVVLRAE